jgi:ceramide glucosyltransferase
MDTVITAIEGLLLIPVIGGSVFAVLCLIAVLAFTRRPKASLAAPSIPLPPATVLKPVCGLEKNLEANLRSICEQDYPEYQVVFSVQDPQDPALPLLREIQRDFGHDRVSVVGRNLKVGLNGKINNLLGGLTQARYDVLVISDSDVTLKPDYLRTMVAPLHDPEVGCVTTMFKATRADRWFEKIELLTVNADFTPSVAFAYMSGASKFCLGPSIALRRSTLKEIGGFEDLADYLVEDYELGRRIWASGKKIAVPPYLIDVVVGLRSVANWWGHQLYWDQNTRCANPVGFFATIFTKSVPFAFLFAAMRLADPVGLAVLAGALAVRLASTALILWRGFSDREGLASLALLPLRDLIGLVTWAMAFTQRTVIWRDREFVLTRNGRLVPKSTYSPAPSG